MISLTKKAMRPDQIIAIEWPLPCKDLALTLEFYTRQLGFRIDAIFPADAPRIAHLSGHGVRIRLEQGQGQAPQSLRLLLADPPDDNSGHTLISPDGTRIDLARPIPEMKLPQLTPVNIVHLTGAQAEWGQGRAGMQYRDLIPGRQGGAIIASHIRIPIGGPVPDYVHYHQVHFQVIYCLKGWVKVVYQDQGDEFLLNEGDCVMQPPGIRHRVLECSDAMEVIELSSPAEHLTLVDHELVLPVTQWNLEQSYKGQRFLRHKALESNWKKGPDQGFETCDTGVFEASNGIASLQRVRVANHAPTRKYCGKSLLYFYFVLQGTAGITISEQTTLVKTGDCFTLPGEQEWTLNEHEAGLEFLQFTLHRYEN